MNARTPPTLEEIRTRLHSKQPNWHPDASIIAHVLLEELRIVQAAYDKTLELWSDREKLRAPTRDEIAMHMMTAIPTFMPLEGRPQWERAARAAYKAADALLEARRQG